MLCAVLDSPMTMTMVVLTQECRTVEDPEWRMLRLRAGIAHDEGLGLVPACGVLYGPNRSKRVTTEVPVI